MSNQALTLPHNLGVAIKRVHKQDAQHAFRLESLFVEAYKTAEKIIIGVLHSTSIILARSKFLCGLPIAWLQKGGRPIGNAYKWIGDDLKHLEDGQPMLAARRFFQGGNCIVNADPCSNKYGLRLTGGLVSIRGGMDRPIYTVPRT